MSKYFLSEPVYCDTFCKDVIKLAHEGKSLAAFKAKYCISERIFNHWMRTYPQFSEAVEIAQCASYAKWEDILLSSMEDTGNDFTFDEDGKNHNRPLSSKEKASIAINMLKHQETLSVKLYGKSVANSDAQNSIGEFGTSDFDEDITDV